MTAGPTDAQALASDGLTWLIEQSTETPAGLAWTDTPSDDDVNPTLYSGAAGIVLTLLEAHERFADDSYADIAIRSARALASSVDEIEHARSTSA